MVLGFGFNKAKVLASAEKNVKAGKLQNAIADYERILKEDPKDLTVMNTVGDLYARVGNSAKATEFFRKVGEAYASEGFTVKAIAMYKKLTKQDPSAMDAVRKLAELYTQQGLYTDARTQYMQLAEVNMRNRELHAAADIFKRILDLDPENIGLQTRLAEIYSTIGKGADARDLYFRSAEALRTKGSLDAADVALANCIKLDPKFSQAIQLRGQLKMETGDPQGAVQALEQLPDIDSRPEGLHALLKAHLQMHNLSEAEPVARKLLKVFNDVSGIADYADALIGNSQCEEALQFYRDHADLLFMSNMAKVTEVLQSTINRVKANTKALHILAELFQRSGNTGNFVEVTELLAHAYAAEGDGARAADLYRKLMDLEPDNPQHAQNYRQVTSDGTTPIPQETAPVVQEGAASVEEIDVKETVEQKYPPAVQEAIDAALTEADLFESYNLPAKAAAPLEAVLKSAPRDIKVNLKLATLYARCGRLKDAVHSCEVLESVYRENGINKDAEQFASLAAKYRQRAGLLPAAPAAREAEPSPAAKAEAPGPVVEHFSNVKTQTAKAASKPPSDAASHEQRSEDQIHEFDLSDEWEEMLEVETAGETAASGAPHLPHSADVGLAPMPPAPVPAPAGSRTQPPVAVFESFHEPQEDASSLQSELAEEIRFYLGQQMWKEARAALTRLELLAPNLAELAALRSDLARGESGASTTPRVKMEPSAHPAPPASPVRAARSAAAAPQRAPERAVQSALTASDEIGGLVADLESSLGDDFEIAPPTEATGPAFAPAQPVQVKPTSRPPRAVSVQPHAAPVVSHRSDAADVPAAQRDAAPSMLSDIFNEFKESMESGGGAQEDPETHYNLGVAFKEMGLLDEAIGELQKVCQTIERGHDFPQAIQAYTWLADSFLQKGVPEAAIRWYEKALKSRQIDDEIATAIHYELACACEAAGDRVSALKHFMEVYGSNIDYRDVAERIKGLKS